MKNIRFIYTLIIISVVSVGSGIGQNRQLEKAYYKFYRLNENHGLSNNVINDIIQDNIGFIWIATNDGLFRYDGAEFIEFRHLPNDSTTIPHNSIQALHLDKNNDIWAFTDFGIGIYSYKSKAIKQILPGEKKGELNYKSTTSVCNAGENKFIGTFGGGLFLYSEGSFEKYIPKHNPDSINFDKLLIMQVHLDNDSILWLGTWDSGIIQIDLKYKDAKQIKQYSGKSTKVYTIQQMKDNSIWIGTNQGLFLFEDANSKPVHYSKDKNEWLPDNEILAIHQTKKGKIWIGTRNAGLLSIDSKFYISEESIKTDRFLPSNQTSSISHRTISKIYADNLGNLWLGTHNSGINVFNPDGESVRYFTHLSGENSISHKSVWGMCEGEPNIIFAGTDGNGVDIVNPYNQKISHIPKGQFSDKAILCALKTSEGKIWFGTYSGGINIYNPKTEKVENIDELYKISELDIRCLYETDNKDIWIGTNSNGLFVYKTSENKLQHISSTNILDIRDIEQDEKGNLWLASFGKGLIKLSLKDYSIKIYNWYLKQDYTPVAFSLVIKDNNIWVGTRLQGLLKFNIETEKFEVFNTNYNLPNSSIRSILFDKLNQIWVSTNIGISFLDLENKTFRNFDSSDGLQVGQFNDNSCILLENGDLAFGGIHGLNVFSPKALLSSQNLPKVVFTDFIVGGQNQNETTPSVNYFIAHNETIELKHFQNTITIKYNALSFPNSAAWEYDYVLKGHEPSWNLCENIRTVTYRNLSPGKYTFQVRSCGKSGIVRGTIKQLEIVVLPPWWKTWPAYILYFSILAFIIYIIFKYNNNQIKLKQGLIFEKKIRQQEHEAMEQQARFFTNFSHELRSPLTLIQGPVNDLLNQGCLEYQKPLLQLIKRNSAVLLKLVKRLLEFRKIETKKTVLYIDKYDLSILVQEEAESFKYQASQLGISLIVNSQPGIYAYVDIEKIQIVLNNLLSNALKYTKTGGSITIGLLKSNGQIKLTVADTGTGIPKSEQEAVFSPFYQAVNSAGKGGTGIGLALTKSLVELHGGTISVESDSSGSLFTIDLPNDKDLLIKNGHIKINAEEKEDIETEEELEEYIDSNNKSLKQVLIVDDNDDILKYVQTQLKNQYHVLTAHDGEEGFELANKLIPDIIISDIMMPKLNGIELCKKLKETENTNHIPILLLTAKAAETSKVEAYKTGADGYITKPFTSELLLARVENLLNQRNKLKELFASGNWEQEPEIEESADIKFMKNAESTILSMIDESEISVPKLAQELGFSRTSLYRKIKALTGLSINQFIRMVKLKQAAQLLTFADVTVSEVAFQMGFTDLKYFRTCFKEKFGTLPSEYQKQYRAAPSKPEDINREMDL